MKTLFLEASQHIYTAWVKESISKGEQIILGDAKFRSGVSFQNIKILLLKFSEPDSARDRSGEANECGSTFIFMSVSFAFVIMNL